MIVIPLISAFKYPALFIGTIVEGPVIMATAGFLVKLGFYKFIPAMLVLTLGDLVGDVIWYYTGYFSAKKFVVKFGRYFGVTENILEKTMALFKKYDTKIIILSKLTMGFGLAIAIIMAAGMSRVSIKKLLILNLAGGFIWTTFVMLLGYLFANAYLLIDQGLRIGFLIMVITILIAGIYGFSRYFKTEILNNKIL